MADGVMEKHQLAGLDERARGFSRLVELERLESTYRASLRYEAAIVVSEDVETKAAALHELIGCLQAKGYTQLRSRLSFNGENYLGSQEPWIEYPDPEREPPPSSGLVGWVRRWLGIS
ncbi:MAG: hypothetical protein ACREIK_06060 [Nitrospiraceae bacterium]